jgi:hypothetical protein
MITENAMLFFYLALGCKMAEMIMMALSARSARPYRFYPCR